MRWGNAKIILGYGDRNAMAHAIESRVPYFDRAFVEFDPRRLPARYKIANGDRKRILRDVARRYIPARITERPDRMGFGTPDEAMLRGPLLPLAEGCGERSCRSAIPAGWTPPARHDLSRDWRAKIAHNDYRAQYGAS